MRIGSILWLILCVALLGWYGFAMIAVCAAVIVIGLVIKLAYEDYKDKKKSRS